MKIYPWDLGAAYLEPRFFCDISGCRMLLSQTGPLAARGAVSCRPARVSAGPV